jgi:carboxypeptidase C (cathepsin A)
LAALLAWYEKFPDYQAHDLWLSGESYAGIYVPLLASQIHNYKVLMGDYGFAPNLKGMLVGNGVTDWEFDTLPATAEMGYQHGLFDYSKEVVRKDCHFEYL